MRARGLVAHVVLATVLLAGAAEASYGGDPPRRDLDLLASSQPTDLRREDRDLAAAEQVARGSVVKADAVATTTTTCHGCRGESATLQVLYLERAGSARLDNVATAWTQDCWDCSAIAISVQVAVLPAGSRVRPTNRALAVGDACATCATGTAAFQVVVQAGQVGPMPTDAMAALRAWFDQQVAVLRTATTSAQPRRGAARAATAALADLRALVVTGLDARPLASRVDVTR